ncbi:MAG: OOP family OmpA-OmpF porin [Myxococcota bacterium]|jgi:OOP family OmpA-OmpF porin
MARIALILMLSVPLLTSAKAPEKAFYIGVFGGGNIVLDDWDLAPFGDAGYSPETSAIFGGRIGGILHPQVGLELGVGLLPTTSETNDVTASLVGDWGGQDNSILMWTLDVLIFLTTDDWAPYIPIGGGGYHALSGDLSDDADFHLHYGIGLRGMLTDWLALRVEARHLMTDGYEGSHVGNNLEITAGLDFYLWTGETGPLDSDEDGIPDTEDDCPTVKGVTSGKGCPDADGDGVVDSRDRCAKTPGPAAFGGCPDRDRDGIPDADDKCPDKPGVPALQGCPDSDGDGITDALDRCPNTPGPKAHKGCPDSDGDGIVDVDDRCPKIPGVPEHQGCLPPEIQKQFSGTFKGIFFDTNKATIRKKSHGVLDNAATVLNRFSGIRVRIEGHTDDRGVDDKNQTLSENRAASVKAYLVSKGVDNARLETVGLGETRPVGDNKTRSGRQDNRRIEFHIITR